MAVRYTEEQLNTVDKSLLIQMFLNQQEQLQTLTAEVTSLNEKMQLMMEQMVLANRNRFGRSSEKMTDASQISFMEVDGTIVFFNEAEAVCDLDAPEPEHLEESAPRPVKKKGKKEQDLSGLPTHRIDHYMTEEELTAEFGKNGWKQLPDEVYKRVCVQPAVYTVEEHHVAVYAGKDNQTIVKADRLKELLRNSILTPSLAASILNAKYVNGLPLYRISQEFLRNDIHISRQVMANWVIQCATGIWGPFMITFITGCTASMCCRPMRLRSRYQRMGGRRTVRVTCGSTGQERDMGIPQSSCMNTRRPGK